MVGTYEVVEPTNHNDQKTYFDTLEEALRFIKARDSRDAKVFLRVEIVI